MLIRIVCPAPPASLSGNRVTALRWARILRDLGHRITIVMDYSGERCDLLIALHARRSAGAIVRFRELHPDKPVVVALTGTDLYRDLRREPATRRSLETADRIVALQPRALASLDPSLRKKVRVIYQSAAPSLPTRGRGRRSSTFFDVCVVGHLRPVKDPFRAARAARLLPRTSQIRVMHAGSAMEDRFAERARAEQRRNPRYQWLGPLNRTRTRRLIAKSRVMVISSRMEGGANVISEAVVEGTPLIASRIPGTVGLLGEDYPGYFPVGDTRALADLLLRSECDAAFYAQLVKHCARLRGLFRPAEERRRWRGLLMGLPGVPQTRK